MFRTPNSKTNPQLDCRKLKPGNGTLALSQIFEEAVSKPDGLSTLLEKDVVQDVLDKRKVQSVNHPGNYLHNVDEEDKLEVGEGFSIELTFEVFALERDSSGNVVLTLLRSLTAQACMQNCVEGAMLGKSSGAVGTR